jgi:hypothetical protein
MSISARSLMTTSPSSLETGRKAAAYIADGFEGSPELVVAYLTVNHEQGSFLRGLSDVLGPNVKLVGCSAQGIAGAGQVREEGYAAGVMALGGSSVDFTHGAVQDIAVDSFEKGKTLGQTLKAGQRRPPTAVVLNWDPFSGVDIDVLLAGLFAEVECPIVGGASAHHFNYSALQPTCQYYNTEVLSRSAVAFAIWGEVNAEIDYCHGVSAAGVELTVTRAEGNMIYEFDGRSAVEMWSEICGPDSANTSQSASLGIGVPFGDGYLVRAAYGMDEATGSVGIGSSIASGTRVMLHHRTVEDVLEGTRRMGARLRTRLGQRPARAVFGFECGARTRPFLGDDVTLSEHLELQRAFPDCPAWLGMMPWGEVFPLGGKPTFHNYSYPMLVLTDRA